MERFTEVSTLENSISRNPLWTYIFKVNKKKRGGGEGTQGRKGKKGKRNEILIQIFWKQE